MSEQQSQPTLGRAQSQPCMGMDIMTMYKIATRENAAWGIEGYQVPKRYNDHIKKRKQAELDEMIKKGKKPGWPAVTATKRGNYLDDEVKMHNPLYPQPNQLPSQYKLKDPWVMKDDVKKQYAQKNRVDQKADKNTFISSIFKKQAKDKAPGPGAYNVVKTQKQVEEDLKKQQTKIIKYGDLPNYLNDYEYQANLIPGPGQYNPKSTQKDTFEWETNKKFLTGNVYYTIEPKKWIDKHNQKKPKQDLSKIDPFPVSYDTFGKKMKLTQEGKNKSGVKHWGTTTRLRTIKEDMDVAKKLGKVNTPGSGTYNLLSKWPDNKPKQKGKPKSKTVLFDYDRISKGTEFTRSIYY